MPKITVKLPRNSQTGSRSTAAEEGPIESGTVFINTTGEEIPAYGVFQGHDTRNQQFLPAVVIAKKPIDGTANASAIFVNGPFAVPDKDFGFAQNGPLYQVLTDGTATAGEGLGLTAGSFEVSPGTGPFIAIGSDDVRDDIFLCLLQAGSVQRMIQGPIATASGAGATVLVVASSDKSMVGQAVTVVDLSGCIFDEEYIDLIGVWVWADWQYTVAAPDGAWVAVNRCCI